jgi:uncharacterized protein YjbJ (UPF0337 family)
MRSHQFSFTLSSLFLTAFPALAQTAAPTTNQASTSGNMAWLWIVLLLIVAGAALWYFVFKNKGSASSRVGVDHDRVAGSAQQAKGSVKDTVGSVLGDTKLQAEGKLDKVEGRAQNTAGGIKDTLRGG